MNLRAFSNATHLTVSVNGTELTVPDATTVRIGDTTIAGQGRALDVRGEPDGISISADPFAQADVYYQKTGDGVAVATSLDQLPIAASPGPLDQAALAHTLCVYGNRPPKQHTVYSGVRRLGVGESLKVRRGDASVVPEPFSPAPTEPYSDDDLHRYADLLIEAVRARASADGNIVYLSSGWDSTAILACLVHLFGPSKVHAVVGRMQYAERSGVINGFEIERARAMAEFFGVSFEIAELDYRTTGPEQLEPLLPHFRSNQVASLVGLNHAVLARAAKKSGRGDVVFAGEISDGAHNLGFSQYVTIFHPVLDFREYSDKMASYLFGPTFMTQLRQGVHAADPIFTLLRGRTGSALFDEPAATEAGRVRQLLSSFFLRGGRLPLWSLANSRMLTSAGREGYREEMERVYLQPAEGTLTPETLYSWYLRLYNSFHWQGSTVCTLALTAESEGLRAALPFWDAGIQQFLSAMPESWGRGLDFNRTKYPLKWTLQHRIRYPYHLQSGPHSYLYDVDPSFSHTAELLYGSSFAPFFKQVLAEAAYRDRLSRDWFDLGYIDGLAERYVDGEIASGAELADLNSLCLVSMTGWY